MDEFKSQIAVIFQKLDTIEKYIKEERDSFKDHVLSSDDFREKVIKHEEQINGINAQLGMFKWMLGIVITVGIAILGKLMNFY